MDGSVIVVGVMLWSGCCAAAQALSRDVYSLFGCLYAYGFLLNLPNLGNFTSEMNDFVVSHFHILNAEKCHGSVLNLRMASVDGRGALCRNIKKHMAEEMRHAALAVAMRMELRAWECAGLLPCILCDGNFRLVKLLLMAANNLKMQWLSNEILHRIQPRNTSVGLYVLLRKFFFDGSCEVVFGINNIVTTKAYRDIHVDFKVFCLEAQSSGRCNDITETQSRFNIVTKHNVLYFMNEELLFVLEQLAENQYLRVSISAEMLRDEDVRLLLRRRCWSLLLNVPIPIVKKGLHEVVSGKESTISVIRAIDVAFSLCTEPENKAEILDTAEPKMREFVLLVKCCEPEDMRKFLRTRTEYINAASIAWIVSRSRLDILMVLFEEMAAMGGIKVLLEAETTYELLKLIAKKSCDVGMLVGTGIELALGCRCIRHMIASDFGDEFMRAVPMHVSKYDIELVRHICKLEDWNLLDRLRRGVRDTGVLDDYVTMVGEEAHSEHST